MSAPHDGVRGPRFEIPLDSEDYPEALRNVRNPPGVLYVMGDPAALSEGLAVVGARRATAYGRRAASLFAGMAAKRGVPVVSGGARGCDSCGHAACLDAGGTTVAFLGGGIARPYPADNVPLFQRIVDEGGALASEHPWDYPPVPHAFRARNRLIAGMSRATLIVEAGLPSGTFSTADEALAVGREVLVVPGSIFSPSSKGSNRLLSQGAMPVVDEESFDDILSRVFPEACGASSSLEAQGETVGDLGARAQLSFAEGLLLDELVANPLRLDEVTALPSQTGSSLAESMARMGRLETMGLIERYPDGRFGAR